MVERDAKQQRLHYEHDECLNEQRKVVAGAGPIKDLQNAGGEHDQRNVEGEARRRPGFIDGKNLVGVRENR